MAPFSSIWDAVVWLLGFVALWIVASIPAYWLLSVWLQLREAVKATLHSLIAHVSAGQVRRRGTAAAVRQDLMDRMRLFGIDQTAAVEWRQTLSTMLDGVQTGGAQIERTRNASTKTGKHLELTGRRLRRLKLVSALCQKYRQSAMLYCGRDVIASH